MTETAIAPILHDSILDTIGDTPLVRLSRIGAGVRPRLVAKLEAFNPGGSIKDRVAVALIEAAERDGRLKPGGTIVEPTSGNTGTGLAIAARLKGYRVIAVMPDKMSREKIDLLRAYGADVVLAPTDVPPESPQSYYRVADRLTAEIPGAFQPNQYFNQANPQAHYESTGPEIWEQTAGQITHLVAGVGTGGTVTGTARYLRERNPDLVVIGADPEGSIYSGRTRERPSVSRRGRRRGLLARDVRPELDRPLDHRVRPRRVPDHAPLGPSRGHPRRWLGRPGPSRRSPDRRRNRRPRRADRGDPPGRRALVPVEDLLRRLDAPVRVPRARLPAPRRRRARPQAGCRRDPAARHGPDALPRARRGGAPARAPRVAAARGERPRSGDGRRRDRRARSAQARRRESRRSSTPRSSR